VTPDDVVEEKAEAGEFFSCHHGWQEKGKNGSIEVIDYFPSRTLTTCWVAFTHSFFSTHTTSSAFFSSLVLLFFHQKKLHFLRNEMVKKMEKWDERKL
jgi:hypothetical protein